MQKEHEVNLGSGEHLDLGFQVVASHGGVGAVVGEVDQHVLFDAVCHDNSFFEAVPHLLVQVGVV